MTTLEHYLRIYLAFNKELGTKHEVSLSGISEVLFCTARNSKMTIQKWENEGWIEWEPGRGRGNKSTLIFLKEPSDLLLNESKRLVKKGKLKAAQGMISEYNKDLPGLKEKFDVWLETLFGYNVESGGRQHRDVLRMKYGKQPFSPLDPMLATLRSECHIVKHVCDTLVSYNEEKNQFEPRLAFHWEHNAAGNQWVFYLRKGIKFHDGQRLTSEDIKYSLERFLSFNNNPYRWMLEDLEEAVTINDYSMELKLKRPNFLLLHILSDEHLSIVSKSEQDELFYETLTGTGPFRLIRNDGSMLILEANDHYFRERPFLDAVEFWNVPDEREDRAPEKTDVEFGYYRDKSGEDQKRKRINRVEKNVQFLSLNTRKPGPMQDSFLRQALKAIADPSALVKELGEFRLEKAEGFLLGDTESISAEIKTLLEKSNYKGEELILSTFQDRDHVEDAEWLKNRAGMYGVKIKNFFLPAEEFLKDESMKNADIIHDSATITEQEELSFLQLILAKTSPIWHHLSWELKETILTEVKLMKGLRNPEERKKKLYIIEEMLLKSSQVLPLYKNMSELESDEIIQQALINSQGWIDFYQIWFKRT
ncbi:ABC transporter substrate-binding protein [Bacillus sp. SCS-153A]|uniref:SgrR family transcriptional regulator n=1 Tax=Rossellomorea sedimentorum TaxID=3115294 RepID=UPI003905DF47